MAREIIKQRIIETVQVRFMGVRVGVTKFFFLNLQDTKYQKGLWQHLNTQQT